MKANLVEIRKSAANGAAFGISAVAAVALVTVAYASVPWSTLPPVTGWAALTAQTWNDIVSQMNMAVKQPAEVITVYDGANVGIGNPAPGQKLSVGGTVESTSGGFKFPNWTVQTTSATSAGKILNVTGYKDCTRKTPAAAASVTISQFAVNKLSPTSILVIQWSIAGFGNAGWSMTQWWKLGAWTETVAQSLMYDENAHGRIYSTSAIISWHATTGSQTLVLRYYTANGVAERPFLVQNSNSTDDARLAQTCSVYTVMEVEQ